MPETRPMTQKDRSETPTVERTHGGVTFTPRVDIYETDKELVVCADMPGVRPEDVDLRYERGELLLHGRVRPRQRAGQCLLAEYEDGDFYRAFSIHESIDNTKIDAECKNGVLTIHLPKAAAAQPKQISVKGG
jgi:HSP20 family protein